MPRQQFWRCHLGAVLDVIAAAGGFAGKVLIDATNPLGMGSRGLRLTIGFSTSGAETIAAMAPGAKLFKAFNQTGFENMADATAFATRPVRFVAGDDAAAKPLVMGLVTRRIRTCGRRRYGRIPAPGGLRDALDRTRPQAGPGGGFHFYSAM